MADRVTIEIRNHVADVTLNRPDKYNALDRAMFEAIIDAGESLASEPGVRAVVLSGAGGNFCAGLDMGMFRDPDQLAFAETAMKPHCGGPANFFQSPAMVWKSLPVPVIAALDGVVFGGGLQIALGADIRLASASARLSIMEIKWGLIPDMGLSQTLRQVMPVDRVKLLTWTGRIVSGVEACQQGLVTEVCDEPLQAARTLAADIASMSPDAIRAGKQLFEQSWRGDVADGLQLEASLQHALMYQPNQREAVSANLEKRAPVFRDTG